jgi:transcriptional regulator with XRE-family HTH domain
MSPRYVIPDVKEPFIYTPDDDRTPQELAYGVMNEIRRLRKEHGISQQDMAELMGFTQSNWNRKEKNSKNHGLKVETVFEASRVLGVHPAKLLGLDFKTFTDLFDLWDLLSPANQEIVCHLAKALAVLEVQMAKVESR